MPKNLTKVNKKINPKISRFPVMKSLCKKIINLAPLKIKTKNINILYKKKSHLTMLWNYSSSDMERMSLTKKYMIFLG